MSRLTANDKTRREFFRQAARITGGAGLAAMLLDSVRTASAIDPQPGSTWLDAEHVVVLMQENRSFDHAFGTLRGVRGFNDPRAVTLPDGNPVWLQTRAAGETCAPFRLNIRESNSTWLGSLPHSWRDQTDARNSGNHDKWLDAKPSGRKECAGMPLTLGYYTREDLPFYYALADAFTICDQNFCSSLTGTTPNRLYLWTGAIRDRQDGSSAANVRNSDVDYGSPVKWTTFPERLEDAGISWKIYQNEISLVSGLSDEEDAWLANFTDNPIEWFEQYNVQFSKTFRAYAEKAVDTLPREIAALDKKISESTGAIAARLTRRRNVAQEQLKMITAARTTFTDEAYRSLPQRSRNLHEKAFCTNSGDPAYRALTTLRYSDGGKQREMKVPKGDVLHQFRADVASGALPRVSWIVPPEQFSDHPGAPWYGAWMLSEVLNILTHNPEVWRKTIFILTYDENDGYFDHVAPFAAPDPRHPEAGRTSDGIDPAVEYWPLERDLQGRSPAEARGSSIGLGFRVPLIVASPWSRGGYVCSQVFDHTSVLRMLEVLLTHKSQKKIRESNISAWRRAVCGDLSSTFRPAASTAAQELDFPERDRVLEDIHKAQFKPLPSGYRKLSASDVEQFRRNRFGAAWMPRQETGVRPSTALPYQLYASGGVSEDGSQLEIEMEARNEVFGARSAGSPFHVYTPETFRGDVKLRTRAYAVEAGKRVTDTWSLDGFPGRAYKLCICGPNGFLRELAGNAGDPRVTTRCEYARKTSRELTGDVEVVITNGDPRDYTVQIVDNAYGDASQSLTVPAHGKETTTLRLRGSHSWYDFSVRLPDSAFERRFAGRVETGRSGYSDPVMGKVKMRETKDA